MRTIGRYQVSESLGQGGMGTVYKAFDPLLARTVAVKVIAAQLGGSPEHHERFFREARAAAHLSHRNIITIHDLGEENGTPFLAMEFLEGRDLEKRMRSQEPMSLARKLEIALGVCDGLSHAHACGVVHRDIKPANIFITDGGEVKILDFGLARLVSSEITRSNVMLGTVNYMAPEQIRAERIDHRADVFSLGVVLYELFSGRKAFPADSFASAMYKILQETPEPLEQIDAEIPPALAAAVDRAMAKARDDRYQHVTDLARDLERVYIGTHGADPRFVRGIDSDLRSQPATRVITETDDTPTMAGVPAPDPDSLTPPPSNGAPSSAAETGGTGASRSAPTIGMPPVSAPSAPRRRWPLAAGVGIVIAVAGFAALARPWRAPGAGAPVAAHDPPPARSAPPAPTPPASPPAAPGPQVTSPEIPERAVPSTGEVPPTREDPQAADRARTLRTLKAARQALEGGDRSHASQLVNDVLRADPGNREALQLRDRLVAETRSRAEQGLADMDAGRRAALAAGAASSTPDLFAAAERSAGAARQAFGAQQYPEASARADDAAALFRDAEAAARRAVAQADRAHATVPDHPAAEQKDTNAGPPPAPPAPPPALAPAPAAAEARAEPAIAAVVDRYIAALVARDLDALKAVWPGLGGAQEAAIRSDFDNARSVEASFDRIAVEVSGGTATASGVRHYVVRTRDGHRLESDTRTTILLRRSGAQWVIDSIRYQPAR